MTANMIRMLEYDAFQQQVFEIIMITTYRIIVAIGVCNDGRMRLVGGHGSSEGRLEICLSEQWGRVCGDRYWDSNDAKVVCKQLGYLSTGMHT